MSVGIVHFLFVGGFLFAAGALAAARQRSFSGALAGLPLMLGGAGLDLVAGSRFATTSADQLAGQGFAVLLAALTLAFVAAGVAVNRLETPR
jgi:NADH:ubiquinone oxidoreductase subunit K